MDRKPGLYYEAQPRLAVLTGAYQEAPMYAR
jgi:hypothetical protein